MGRGDGLHDRQTEADTTAGRDPMRRRRRKGCTIRSIDSVGTTGPLLMTRSSTSSRSFRVMTRIHPPSWLYAMALWMRLLAARSRRTGSPLTDAGSSCWWILIPRAAAADVYCSIAPPRGRREVRLTKLELSGLALRQEQQAVDQPFAPGRRRDPGPCRTAGDSGLSAGLKTYASGRHDANGRDWPPMVRSGSPVASFHR
jgi:hypothetical protein